MPVPASLRAIRVAVAACALLVVFAACSPTATPAPSVAQSTPVAGGSTVTIDNFAFAPPSLTVAVGTKVTWTNRDPDTHTVTADDGSFDSGHLGNGATFSQTFSKAGTFAYHCTIHSFMTATIVVQ